MKAIILIIISCFVMLSYAQKPIYNDCETLQQLASFSMGDKSKTIEFLGVIPICDKDYVWTRDTIELLSSNFSVLSNEAKDIVGLYCASPMDTLVAYYMGLGYSQSDAINYYLNRRIVDINKAGASYCDRINKTSLQVLIITYLGEYQGLTFNDAVRSFKDDLCSYGLLGTQYGDVKDGIMDYIESTGSYINGGLKSYTINADIVLMYGGNETLAWQDLIAKIHNIIINNQ